jgi:imidazolonepropionase-like amidohydrolase
MKRLFPFINNSESLSMIKRTMVIALICSLFVLSPRDSKADSENCDLPVTLITSVRVFDGENLIPEATVLIRCAQIAAVFEGTGSESIPEDALIIDGRGKTLLPGLIDAHTHVWKRGTLERALDFGVTALFDMGSGRGLARSIKDEDKQNPATDRADLLSAVLWVTAPDSHGTQFGEVPTLVEPGDANAFVAQRIADGADYIKIIYDHFKMFDFEIPTLSRETMVATVAAAHSRGKMAVVHSRDVEAIAHVTEAGVNGLVHAPVDEVPDSELIEAMKKNNMFVTPNLSLARPDGQRLIEDPFIGPMLNEGEIENLGKWRGKRRGNGDVIEYQSVIAFHQAGIPIIVGTDMPNGGTANGASVHLELELLVEAGLTPLEALRAATSRPSEIYGLNDRGWIAAGMRADLLLVDGNPDQVITDTRKILKVWKSGELQ